MSRDKLKKPIPSDQVEADQQLHEDVAASKGLRQLQRDVLLCCLDGDKLEAVHLQNKRNKSCNLHYSLFLDSESSSEIFKKVGKRSSIVLLLRSKEYMTRVVELPRAADIDVTSMLSLEIESSMSSEIGQRAIAYRNIQSDREGYSRYEVYMCRETTLDRIMSYFSQLGRTPTMILPETAVWAVGMTESTTCPIWVAESSDDTIDVASASNDGSVAVRMLDSTLGVDQSSGLHFGLVDLIRTQLLYSKSGESVKVVWLGSNCPSKPKGNQVQFVDMKSDLINSVYGKATDFDKNPLLHFMAIILATCQSQSEFETANLLPSEVLEKQHWARLYRQFGVLTCGLILSMVMLYISLQMICSRYEKRLMDINQKITRVKVEGDQIGRRIEQIDVVRQTRKKRNEFVDLMAGLYRGTPDGITYSHVVFSEDARIRLRGQAKSLSLPFLLPQSLERMPMFRNVLLKDAGQSKSGEGSSAEFKLECTFERGAAD